MLSFLQISYVQFRNYVVSDSTEYVFGLARLAALELDPEQVDEYIALGHAHPDYDRIESRLYRLREGYPDAVFLYIYKIRED